jgi:bifunctional non-homologous end joining protein LigD
MPRIKPMSPRLVREAFDDSAFLFELKHDGFRAVCYIENGECRLVSRNLRNLRFESLQKTLAKLSVENAILDGEIICLDQHGVSQFYALLERSKEPVFYAFDLLWLNGTDLQQLSLIERKNQLSKLIQASGCNRLLYAQHIEEYGRHFFKEICTRDLEGIVAKRKLSVYKPGGSGWLKIKNKSYSQADGRHERLTKRR